MAQQCSLQFWYVIGYKETIYVLKHLYMNITFQKSMFNVKKNGL